MKYLFKKTIYSLSILWGVVSVIFLLFNILPGDPSKLTVGQRADVATLENVKKELHLDKPVWQRYLYYLNDLSPLSIHNNTALGSGNYQFITVIKHKEHSIVLKKPYLGRSYQTKRLVSTVIGEAMPGTIVLALAAIIFATVAGIGLGILAALKKDTIWDTSSILASVLGISAPSFFAGLIIAYILGYKFQNITQLEMMGSLWTYDENGKATLSLKNLILPALTLGIRPLAIITQLTRSALLDVLSQDYIRTAYAKGLKKHKVIFKHALPNALNPVVTAISGWMAELLAGSFFVEYIFSWKGLGKLTVDALDKFDFPLVMGGILVAATIFIFINLLTDILYRQLDPRVTLD
jgi:peptide/nickel transport system permease protein